MIRFSVRASVAVAADALGVYIDILSAVEARLVDIVRNH